MLSGTSLKMASWEPNWRSAIVLLLSCMQELMSRCRREWRTSGHLRFFCPGVNLAKLLSVCSYFSQSKRFVRTTWSSLTKSQRRNWTFCRLRKCTNRAIQEYSTSHRCHQNAVRVLFSEAWERVTAIYLRWVDLNTLAIFLSFEARTTLVYRNEFAAGRDDCARTFVGLSLFIWSCQCSSENWVFLKIHWKAAHASECKYFG